LRPQHVRLDHCVIHVSDWGRSNRFYRDVLGAELIGDPDGVAIYRFGEQQLCFAWAGPIEGAIDHLSARGVEVELGPVRRRGARGEGTSVYFRDPEATPETLGLQPHPPSGVERPRPSG
jgi:catechol 2,3-dioxygenase-like lactoylglutathione lyase family enzyme